VADLAWGPGGYSLLVAEAGRCHHLLELPFAKSPASAHRVLHAHSGAASRQQQEEVHMLQVTPGRRATEVSGAATVSQGMGLLRAVIWASGGADACVCLSVCSGHMMPVLCRRARARVRLSIHLSVCPPVHPLTRQRRATTSCC
jgi:hypothetical protein